MGYTTEFSGVLKFAGEVDVPTIRELNKYLGKDLRDLEPDKKHEGNYIDLALTPEMDGLKWSGAEKTYGMVETVNWLIAKMCETYPSFGLAGTLEAQGEEADDKWRLEMKDGKAVKTVVPPRGTKVECPKCGHHFRVEV